MVQVRHKKRLVILYCFNGQPRRSLIITDSVRNSKIISIDTLHYPLSPNPGSLINAFHYSASFHCLYNITDNYIKRFYICKMINNLFSIKINENAYKTFYIINNFSNVYIVIYIDIGVKYIIYCCLRPFI